MDKEEYENGFEEFLLSGIDNEAKLRYKAAVSDYFKALTELNSFIITTKLLKSPQSHNEVFLFLRINFPEIHKIADDLFGIYTSSYNKKMTKEDCEKIKDGIRNVIEISGVSEKIKRIAEKIS